MKHATALRVIGRIYTFTMDLNDKTTKIHMEKTFFRVLGQKWTPMSDANYNEVFFQITVLECMRGRKEKKIYYWKSRMR